MKFASIVPTLLLISFSSVVSMTADDCDSEPGEAPQLFISEYYEGASYDKSIEIYNASDEYIDLGYAELWLAYNGNEFSQTVLVAGEIEPYGTFVVSNSQANQGIIDRSNLLTSYINFNGNDTIGLAWNGELIDVVGQEGVNPETGYDVGGTEAATFDHKMIRKSSIEQGNVDWAASSGQGGTTSEWDVYALGDFSTLGQHAVGEMVVGCYEADTCAEGYSCQGVPSEYYGGMGEGCCIDSAPIEGQYLDCEETSQCGDALLCIAGTCSPEWMAETFSSEEAAAIPDNGVLNEEMQVSCLGSVAVDVLLDIKVEHSRPQDLRITMTDPTEDITTVIFDHQEIDGTTIDLSDVNIIQSGDFEVNAPWKLKIEDTVTGETGTLVEWSLYITSRFD